MILDKSFLMGMRRTDVRLNNPKCLPTDNGTHFLFQTNFTSCGTKLIDTDNFFIYENTIQEKPPQGIITRLADVDIPFRCCYLKEVQASAIQLETSRKIIRGNASDVGMFDINLGVFKDQGYTRPYGDQSFPIGVKVNERVFLQLSVDSEDRRLAVQAQRCHATPDPNPNSTIQYNLILNGCPQDPTVQYHHNDDNKGLHRFSVQTFQFVNSPDPFVYIHCKAVVCNSSDPNSECSKNCDVLPRNRHRRALPYSAPVHITLLSHGPIWLTNTERVKDSPWQHPLIGVSVVLGMFAVLCLVVIAVVRRKMITVKRGSSADV